MARKPFIGANIKMNPLPRNLDAFRATTAADVVIFPSYFDLKTCLEADLSVGAQYGNAEDKGAFTGDVSMAMLKALGVTHIICGHSERRKYDGETDEGVAKQVGAALRNGLHPILCIGETEADKKAGKTHDVLRQQLNILLSSHASLLTAHSFLVSYEPVWAIGTGKTPSVPELESTHAYIRSLLPDKRIRIIYGGSVTAENAKEILGCADVDGALVGGASLDPKGFKKIVDCATSKD